MFITLNEILDIIIIIAIVGYIFKDFIKVKHHTSYHEDPIKFYQQKPSFSNLKVAILVTAPAIILHELGHKFMAMAFGMTAVLKAAYEFLLLGIVLKILNFGFIFFVPAYVRSGCATEDLVCIANTILNPWIYSLIAFAGPMINGIIWLTCYFMLKSSNTKSKYKPIIFLTKRINGFLFVLNLLPIPGFDGWHVIRGIIESIKLAML